MEQLGSNWTDFDKTWYLRLFRKSVEKIQIPLKFDIITGRFHEDASTFLTKSGKFIFRMRNVLDKSCRENDNIRFMCSNIFRKSHRFRDYAEKCGGDWGTTNDVTIWRMQACTHARARKHAHTDQYVILTAFLQQQWFLKRASMLRYTHIVCLLVIFSPFTFPFRYNVGLTRNVFKIFRCV
jgi:hypothetical protein